MRLLADCLEVGYWLAGRTEPIWQSNFPLWKVDAPSTILHHSDCRLPCGSVVVLLRSPNWNWDCMGIQDSNGNVSLNWHGIQIGLCSVWRLSVIGSRSSAMCTCTRLSIGIDYHQNWPGWYQWNSWSFGVSCIVFGQCCEHPLPASSLPTILMWFAVDQSRAAHSTPIGLGLGSISLIHIQHVSFTVGGHNHYKPIAHLLWQSCIVHCIGRSQHLWIRHSEESWWTVPRWKSFWW